MYLSILPQFISTDGNTAIQALIMSVIFISGCGVVYMVVGLIAAGVLASVSQTITEDDLKLLQGQC